MFRNERLELKVGLFIGAGIFIMFLIVFSISDLYLFKPGYELSILFDYVNGIGIGAPVRFAGVHVGEVRNVNIFYSNENEKTCVKLKLWVDASTRIEQDAGFRINTLGILGEQYIEISSGALKNYLKGGDTVIGKNPVNVGRQMEIMSEFIGSGARLIQRLEAGEGSLGKFLVDEKLYDSLADILEKLDRGEGTLGKLLADDVLHEDIGIIFRRLAKGEGTLGKLIMKESLYNNMEEFTGDIKSHPWKLLRKPSKRELTKLKRETRNQSTETR